MTTAEARIDWPGKGAYHGAQPADALGRDPGPHHAGEGPLGGRPVRRSPSGCSVLARLPRPLVRSGADDTLSHVSTGPSTPRELRGPGGPPYLPGPHPATR